MNKNIEKAFANYSFTFDKFSGYGEIHGYEVNITNNPMDTGPILFISTYLHNSKKSFFINQVLSYRYKMVQASSVEYGVCIKIGAMTGGSFAKKAPEIIERIFSLLERIEAPKKEICPFSGLELAQVEHKKVTLPYTNIQVTISQDAISKINFSVDKENQRIKNSPNNYFLGFIGIGIGALVGLVVSYVLSLLGFISAISAFVSILLGTYLYKKFGAKPNAVMIIMALVTTVVAMVGFNYFIYSAAAETIIYEAGITLHNTSALKYCLANSVEFKGAFLKDSIMTFIFCALGAVASASSLKRSVQKPKKL